MQQRQLQQRCAIGFQSALDWHALTAISEPTTARTHSPHKVFVPVQSETLKAPTIVAYEFASQAAGRYRPIRPDLLIA